MLDFGKKNDNINVISNYAHGLVKSALDHLLHVDLRIYVSTILNRCLKDLACSACLLILMLVFLDPCKKRVCEYNSKCIRRSDETAECSCPVCTENNGYSPVCGDDGKTYASQCELERSSCEHKKNMKVVKKKACGELSEENFFIFWSWLEGLNFDNFDLTLYV